VSRPDLLPNELFCMIYGDDLGDTAWPDFVA
jgi:hypothetical protein